jgi:hypothetical protein
MQEQEKELLEDILTAQVMILEKQICAEKNSRCTSGAYYGEAISAIKRNKPNILRLIRDMS